MSSCPESYWSHSVYLLALLSRTVLLQSSQPDEANSNQYFLRACLTIERISNESYYGYESSAAAIDLAVQYANELVLPRHIRLSTYYIDIGNECSTKSHVLADVTSRWENGEWCDVFIGPGCASTADTLYDFTAFIGVPMIACPAPAQGIDAPYVDYSLMATMSFNFFDVASTLLRFLDLGNYTTPTFFQDTSTDFFDDMGTWMQICVASLSPRNVTGLNNFVLWDSDYDSVEKIRVMFTSASSRSRVFVLFANSDAVRRVMITAHRLGMTEGGYVFVAVNLYPSTFWGNFSWDYGDEMNQVAREAYRVLLLLKLRAPEHDPSQAYFSSMVKKFSRDNSYYIFGENENIDPVINHFYESIILYASVVARIAQQKLDIRNGSLFAKFFNRFTFTSPIDNRAVHLTTDGDRRMEYEMHQMDRASGKFQSILTFLADENKTEIDGMIDWPDGSYRLPPNTPRCGFDGRALACQAHPVGSAVLSSIVVVSLVVLALLIFGARRWWTTGRMIHHADSYWWRIFSGDIIIQNQTLLQPFSNSTLSVVKFTEEKKMKEEKGKTDGKTTQAVVGVYQGALVQLVEISDHQARIGPELNHEAAMLQLIQHDNLQKLFGVAVNEDNICESVVGEVCQKGTLTGLILYSMIDLDWPFKNSLIRDLVAGMAYLHGSRVFSHGNLTSHTCLIDSRYVLKITDHVFVSLRNTWDSEPPENSSMDSERDFLLLLWRAPELLRRRTGSRGTQKGDVYSFSIILQQIILRSLPFRSSHKEKKREDALTDREIVMEIKRGTVPALRPRVPVSLCGKELYGVLNDTWEEDPIARPSFSRIKDVLKRIVGTSGDSMVDHLFRKMDSHAAKLEHQVEVQLKQLMEEKQRSDDILNHVLPRATVMALAQGLRIIPESFGSSTVQFSSIDGFKELYASHSHITPKQVVNNLNTLHSLYDAVLENYNAFAVESYDDALLTVSGVPVRNGNNHVAEIAALSLDLKAKIHALKVFGLDDEAHLKLRSGIHSGPCVAGVIGQKLPKYCLFGETVNTASRMESHGQAGRIQITEETKNLLEKVGGFFIMERGLISVKDKGMMDTYWLVGKE